MKFIKSGLLTLLVSLFILSGCKNPTGIGLDLDPNNILNSKADSASIINAKLIKQDSFVSNYTTRAVLGYFKDPIFGTTTASMAMALNLPSSGYSFGIDPVLDSAVLVLPYADFYGDSLNTSYQVEVRQLNEVLYNESSKSYYSNKIWATQAAVIGTKTFRPNYRDSIDLTDFKVGAPDTVKTVPGQLRIRLDPTFVTNNILKADSVNLVSNLTFNNLIKGLYISLNKNNTTNNGGMFSFGTTSGSCRLDLFYKKTSTTGTIDTITTSLAMNGEAGDIATELSWDLNGTVVKTELQSSAVNSDKLYFKGLNGTSVKLSVPDATLARLKGLGKNVTINRAELILSAVENDYTPLPRLRMFRWDIAHRPQYLPDENPSDPRNIGQGYIGGFYSTKNKNYVFNITGYIQDLMNNRTKDYGTFITTSDFTSSSSLLSNLGRSVTGGANPSYKIKLKVYYTDQK